MNAVHQIEQAIEALTHDQLTGLYMWFEEKYQQVADERLKAAIDRGHFDEIIKSAPEDEAAGRLTLL